MSVYGGLKRLHEWNEASVDVVSDHVGDICSTFTAWVNSLHVSVNSADSRMERLPVWHGSVLIHGSEVIAVNCNDTYQSVEFDIFER